MSFGNQASRDKKQVVDETPLSSEALNFSPSTLPVEEADLNRPFTAHEVRDVMKSLDVSTGAGSDGLPSSFRNKPP